MRTKEMRNALSPTFPRARGSHLFLCRRSSRTRPRRGACVTFPRARVGASLTTFLGTDREIRAGFAAGAAGIWFATPLALALSGAAAKYPSSSTNGAALGRRVGPGFSLTIRMVPSRTMHTPHLSGPIDKKFRRLPSPPRLRGPAEQLDPGRPMPEAQGALRTQLPERGTKLVPPPSPDEANRLGQAAVYQDQPAPPITAAKEQ